MMANISWLECATKYSLLLLVTSGLSIIPSVTCRTECNTGHDGEPLLIEITSSPSATRALPVGVPINLTCKAWQTDNVATFVRKRPRDIQWYDAQDKPVGVKCNASIKIREKELWCTLILGSLTSGAFRNYTCQASNWYGYCSRKLFEISLQDITDHVL
ncbi:hypothetical protein OS493_003676 [Desmophyllum pertusum]|uniref:Ig-like domain-containing protein n=1 Tax=Desmophyllum pertusum TaxID=174260 RepID=A0A9X0DBM7_9CNID|nr:hypothetical protein OS493_003676 [Desmophyllum pertusum]